jgi:hypothetical protein
MSAVAHPPRLRNANRCADNWLSYVSRMGRTDRLLLSLQPTLSRPNIPASSESGRCLFALGLGSVAAGGRYCKAADSLFIRVEILMPAVQEYCEVRVPDPLNLYGKLHRGSRKKYE